jgi:hypothetical protein
VDFEDEAQLAGQEWKLPCQRQSFGEVRSPSSRCILLNCRCVFFDERSDSRVKDDDIRHAVARQRIVTCAYVSSWRAQQLLRSRTEGAFRRQPEPISLDEFLATFVEIFGRLRGQSGAGGRLKLLARTFRPQHGNDGVAQLHGVAEASLSDELLGGAAGQHVVDKVHETTGVDLALCQGRVVRRAKPRVDVHLLRSIRILRVD